MYVRESAAPFVSMAEMMNRFHSSTRDLSLPHVNGSLSHVKELVPSYFFQFFTPFDLVCQVSFILYKG